MFRALIASLFLVLFFADFVQGAEVEAWKFRGEISWDHPDGRTIEGVFADTKVDDDDLRIFRDTGLDRYFLEMTLIGNGTLLDQPAHFFVTNQTKVEGSDKIYWIDGDVRPGAGNDKSSLVAELTRADLEALRTDSGNVMGATYVSRRASDGPNGRWNTYYFLGTDLASALEQLSLANERYSEEELARGAALWSGPIHAPPAQLIPRQIRPEPIVDLAEIDLSYLDDQREIDDLLEGILAGNEDAGVELIRRLNAEEADAQAIVLKAFQDHGLFRRLTPEDAERYTSLAAQKEYPPAMYDYGMILIERAGGIVTIQAHHYMKRAAHAGYGPAIAWWVRSLAEGKIRKRNLDLAERYLALGVRTGHAMEAIREAESALLVAYAEEGRDRGFSYAEGDGIDPATLAALDDDTWAEIDPASLGTGVTPTPSPAARQAFDAWLYN